MKGYVGVLRGLMLASWVWVVFAIAMDIDQENQILAFAIKHFGHQAEGRLKPWFDMMHGALALNEKEKLQRVNSYFNRIPNVSDWTHWGESDYWASPVDLLSTNGGDCEDFALAKYFTLRELGVPNERLRLTYTKAYLRQTGQIQSHMVLTYYAAPGAEPLVLDNLTDEINLASRRTDLTPTYSFNVTTLWAARERQKGRGGVAAEVLSRWSELRASMLRMDTLQ